MDERTLKMVGPKEQDVSFLLRFLMMGGPSLAVWMPQSIRRMFVRRVGPGI